QMDDVIALVEPLIQQVFAAGGKQVSIPFQRLKYQEAMDRFGSDKPDLRYGCELVDVSSWAASTDFRIFQQAEKVKALVAQGCGKYSRKAIDNLEAKAKEFGAAGLIWIKMTKDGPQSSVLKAVGETKVREVWQSLGAKEDDLVVLIA